MGSRIRLIHLIFLMMILSILGGCSETKLAIHSAKKVIRKIEGKPKGRYKVGNPYQIAGTWYYPKVDYEYERTGIASWYGTKFHGRKTANGEIYNMNELTAAHRTLPMPCYVRVTNLENGRSLVLRVNDRGPFAKGRIIDISRRGAQLLKFKRQGTAKVRVKILADKSRALAFGIKNKNELARVGSPITVKKLPKAKVSSESLPSPPGSKVSPIRETSHLKKHAKLAISRADNTELKRSNEPLTGKIIKTTVVSSNIYVQVGAFGEYANANRVQARLASLGSVKISNVVIDGRDLYRVRFGPIERIADADSLLEVVTEAGYQSARIVVD